MQNKTPFLMLLALSAMHAAAGAADNIPPPGLYRVESTGVTSDRSGTVTRHTGADGAHTIHAQTPGADRSMAMPGSGTPRDICIGPRSATGLPLPPMAAQSNCVTTPAVEGPNGVSSSARCSFADIVTTMRKIDARTWEMKADIKMKMAGAGLGTPDFEAQRKRYESIAKTSTNPDTRADAEAVLKNWEQYKANISRSAAKTPSAGAAGGFASSSSVVSRLTRVGDNCKVAAAPRAAP